MTCFQRLRIIHAKKTGKRDTTGGGDIGEEQQSLETPTPGRKRRRKGGDSDYDDDDDDDSDDQADEDEEDEEDKEDKKGKKAEVCEDEVGILNILLTELTGKLKLASFLFLCNTVLFPKNLKIRMKEK